MYKAGQTTRIWVVSVHNYDVKIRLKNASGCFLWMHKVGQKARIALCLYVERICTEQGTQLSLGKNQQLSLCCNCTKNVQSSVHNPPMDATKAHAVQNGSALLMWKPPDWNNVLHYNLYQSNEDVKNVYTECVLTLWSLSLPLSSSSTTSRELLSQFSTCSGWKWLEVGDKWKNILLFSKKVPWKFPF